MPLPKPPAKRADVLSIADAVAAPPAPRQPARKGPARPVASVLAPPAHPAPPVQAEPEARVDPRKRPPLELLTPPATVARQAVRPAGAAQKAGRRAPGAAPTLFVLDTNVLMHDPTALFRFDEHDVYLPMVTLEELDSHKRGMTEVARNARQVSRELDALAAQARTRRAVGAARRRLAPTPVATTASRSTAPATARRPAVSSSRRT
jgi:PhoH-like ATPase